LPRSTNTVWRRPEFSTAFTGTTMRGTAAEIISTPTNMSGLSNRSGFCISSRTCRVRVSGLSCGWM
jgi:hypothetical protein